VNTAFPDGSIVKKRFGVLFLFMYSTGLVSLACTPTITNWSNANAVVEIAFSNDGKRFWTATHGGVLQWNIESQTYRKYTAGSELRDNWYLCASAGKQDDYWFGSRGGGLAHFRNGQWEHWTRDSNGLPYDEILCLDTDADDRLWAGFGAAFGNGLGILEDGTWTFLTMDDGLCHNKVTAIKTVDNGAWIGTANGLDRIEDLKIVASYTTEDGLPEGSIKALASNLSHELWIGTANGLAYLKENKILVFTILDGLPANDILSLYIDPAETLYVGTSNGAAYYHDNVFVSLDPLSGSAITDICSNSGGDIYYAVYGHGVKVFRDHTPVGLFSLTDSLPGNDVRAVACEDDKIWFGTTASGIGWFDGKEWWIDRSGCGIESAMVRDIVIDHSGDKWFSTFDRGVFCFDDVSWRHFDDDLGLPSNNVVSGYVDESNNKWFATWGGGIVTFNGTTFTVIDESDGLPTNLTYAVTRDNTGSYWFAMDNGIIRYKDGALFEHLTEDDGLVFHRVYDISVQSDNSLWIGACKGMSHYKNGEFTNYYQGDGQLNHYRVRNIFFDAFDNVWLTTGGGVNVFDGLEFLSYTPPGGVAGYETYSGAVDSSGHFWFGSEGGLTRIVMDPVQSFQTGVSVFMPAGIFYPGDTCRVDMEIRNGSAEPLVDIPVCLFLEVAGTYFFAPSYTTEPDMFLLPPIEPNSTRLKEIVPDFIWPIHCGSFTGARWFAALLTPDLSAVIGETGEWVFGWSE
jgi:ligand-binding sensor domain-containing protein